MGQRREREKAGERGWMLTHEEWKGYGGLEINHKRFK